MDRLPYVHSILQPNEEVKFVGRFHWIRYMRAVTAFVLSIVCFWVAHEYGHLRFDTVPWKNIEQFQTARTLSEGTLALVGWVSGVILLLASLLLAAKVWWHQ